MADWQNPLRTVILASGSPRRQELLTRMGISFTTMVGEPLNEQAYLAEGELTASLERLSFAKAAGVAERNPAALVLGADTIVVKNNHVLGKPKSRDDAHSMLKLLANSKHTVMTALTLLCREVDYSQSVTVATTVFFRDISDSEIEAYTRSEEYRDKAGAYAIQGEAMIFIDKIEGCFYNVVGLPVRGTINLFTDFVARKESLHVAK